MMKKASVLIITGISVLLCAAVFWQWLHFSTKTSKTDKEPNEGVSQSVIVNVEQHEFHIKQVFSDLKGEKYYTAAIPKNALNLSCKTESGEACDVNRKTNALKTAGSQLTFEYNLNGNPSDSEILLNNWLVVLKELPSLSIKIEIIDKQHQNGTWAAGLPLKGFKEKELVSYSVFEGDGYNPSIYWNSSRLVNDTSQEGISYYRAKSSAPSHKFSNLDAFAANQHVSVIFRDKGQIVRTGGLLLVDGTLSKDELEKQLAITFLASKFPGLPAGENWLLDGFASLITNQPASARKSQSIIQEMKNKLTSDELKQFVRFIAENNTPLSHQKLDEKLAKIKGMETLFFTLNKENNSMAGRPAMYRSL
jgi:hypothetical protein